jgi:hypothetical protein
MVMLSPLDPDVIGGFAVAALAGSGFLLILSGVLRREASLRDWIGMLVITVAYLGLGLAYALGWGRAWTTGFLLIALAGMIVGAIALVRRSRRRSLDGPRHG